MNTLHTILLLGRELIPQMLDYPKHPAIRAYNRIVPIIILEMFDKENLQNAFIVFMILKVIMDLTIYTFLAKNNA
jgi:hypothetical protein